MFNSFASSATRVNICSSFGFKPKEKFYVCSKYFTSSFLAPAENTCRFFTHPACVDDTSVLQFMPFSIICCNIWLTYDNSCQNLALLGKLKCV